MYNDDFPDHYFLKHFSKAQANPDITLQYCTKKGRIMKKVIFFLMLSVFLFVNSVYAQESLLVGVRDKFMSISKEIKPLLSSTQDVIIMNSMWDSSIMAASQLDAYFSMAGVFNAVKPEDVTPTVLGYLLNWLEIIKKTNELNIKSLESLTTTLEPGTKTVMEKFKEILKESNLKVEVEIAKLSVLNKKLALKQPETIK
jgi:hypothetical protein